jgi:hypothetical protein
MANNYNVRSIPTTPEGRHRKAVGGKEQANLVSTPHAIRTSSAPRSDKSLTNRVMKSLLRRELQQSIFTAVPWLVDSLFSNVSLPFEINKQFVTRFPMYDSKKNTWKNFPFDKKSKKKSTTNIEQMFASFFNEISQALVVHGNPRKKPSNVSYPRSWSADFCGRKLPGEGGRRQPDLILLDNLDDTEPPSWTEVLCLGEITGSTKLSTKMKDTIATKSYSMFQG